MSITKLPFFFFSKCFAITNKEKLVSQIPLFKSQRKSYFVSIYMFIT